MAGGEISDSKALIATRVILIGETGNLALAMEPGVLTDARRLADSLTGDLDRDLPTMLALGSLFWYRFLAQQPVAHSDDFQVAFTMLVPCFLKGYGPIPSTAQDTLVRNCSDGLLRRLRQAKSVGQPLTARTIEVARAVAGATASGHELRAVSLANLGDALAWQFEVTSEQAMLDEAVQAYTEAVAQTAQGDVDRTARLSKLAAALMWRAEAGDLDRAIAGWQLADDLDDDALARAGFRSNRGIALRLRSIRTGNTTDLDEAVKLGRLAVGAMPAGHPDRRFVLSHLASSLLIRAENNRSPEDLADVIELSLEALIEIEDGHHDQAANLSNLAGALATRFAWTGSLSDVDQAIIYQRQALELGLPGSPDHCGRVFNLGCYLLRRFTRTQATVDLDDAIAAFRSAGSNERNLASLTPDTTSNLAVALISRFDLHHEVRDLDEAIELLTSSLDNLPAGHVDRARNLANLGTALSTRSELTGNPGDRDNAIDYLYRAVTDGTRRHPDRAVILLILAAERLKRIRSRSLPRAPHTAADEALDVPLTMVTLQMAAEEPEGAPSVRIAAARMLAALAIVNDPRYAARLLEDAVALLPRISPRHLRMRDQQVRLGGISGLAADAAALALTQVGGSQDRPERATAALRILEAGRAILFSQALGSHADLERLRRQRPDLAERYTELRDLLDSTGAGNGGLLLPVGSGFGAAVRSATLADRHILADEFEALLREIRAIEGCGQFMLPPSAGELGSEAREGPIVVCNVSDYGSAALLLLPEAADFIPLPALTPEEVRLRASSFHDALLESADADVSPLRRVKAQQTITGTLEWLWDVAAEPVLHRLGLSGPPEPGDAPPRIWWVSTGLLGQLPVHAAGYHAHETPQAANRTVIDRANFSYIPSVRALRFARENSRLGTDRITSLVVSVQPSPGDAKAGPDPSMSSTVSQEAHLLVETLPNPRLLINEPYPGSVNPTFVDGSPDVAHVISGMSDASFVHFSCHGVTDGIDPSRSRLVLDDEDTISLSIVDLAPIHLERAQLAYLAACRTSLTGDLQLVDEAIHLTSAFQLAGFPHVIGTFWEIADDYAPGVACAFYAGIRNAETGVLEPSRSAESLRKVALELRRTARHMPFLWAPYLHAGA